MLVATVSSGEDMNKMNRPGKGLVSSRAGKSFFCLLPFEPWGIHSLYFLVLRSFGVGGKATISSSGLQIIGILGPSIT